MLVRCQVRLQGKTNVPADVFVNTLYYDTGGTYASLALAADGLDGPIHDFYNAISTYLSDFVDGATSDIRFYDMAQAEPRVPEVRPLAITVNNGSALNLPEEVACCLSFHGIPPITPRRRGRIYIGPLNTDAMTSTDGQRTVISSAFRTQLASAVPATLGATAGADWVIRSVAGGNTVNVAAGFINDAPDTQRRRGPEDVNRSTFSV